jgi:hypothetical protein
MKIQNLCMRKTLFAASLIMAVSLMGVTAFADANSSDVGLVCSMNENSQDSPVIVNGVVKTSTFEGVTYTGIEIPTYSSQTFPGYLIDANLDMTNGKRRIVISVRAETLPMINSSGEKTVSLGFYGAPGKTFDVTCNSVN